MVRVTATEIAHEGRDRWLAGLRHMAAQEVPCAAGLVRGRPCSCAGRSRGDRCEPHASR
jgi:hypothetical protein